MSSLFLSFLLKTNFLFHKNHFLFLQKLGEGKKSSVLALSLCRSRQILGYICRPIKGSQLTPHVQVDLHVYLLKFMSFFSSKFHVCKVLSVNTFLCFMVCLFFHYVCFESFVFSSFENVIELE